MVIFSLPHLFVCSIIVHSHEPVELLYAQLL